MYHKEWWSCERREEEGGENVMGLGRGEERGREQVMHIYKSMMLIKLAFQYPLWSQKVELDD